MAEFSLVFLFLLLEKIKWVVPLVGGLSIAKDIRLFSHCGSQCLVGAVLVGCFSSAEDIGFLTHTRSKRLVRVAFVRGLSSAEDVRFLRLGLQGCSINAVRCFVLGPSKWCQRDQSSSNDVIMKVFHDDCAFSGRIIPMLRGSCQLSFIPVFQAILIARKALCLFYALRRHPPLKTQIEILR